MAANSDAPGFVIFQYVVATRVHRMKLHVIPSGTVTPEFEPTFATKAGSTISMGAAMAALLTVTKPAWHTSVDLQYAEFWSQPNPEDDPLYIYTHPIGENGTSSTAINPAAMVTNTLRTAAGGIMKFVQIDTSFAANVISFAPHPTGYTKTLTDYLKSSDSPWCGKDNSYATISLKQIIKYNDVVLRKILGY